MSVTRKNTIVVDFGILPKRPDAGKVQQFLEKNIQLQLADVENIQLHNIKNCVYIEVKDGETAERYQRLHNNRHMVFHEDKGFKIPVYVESESIPVRVHDLPPAMKHTTVIDFLKSYGEVMSVTRERWKNYFPGIYNGVRILHMKIKHPIPSFVTINGQGTTISYPGQQRTCQYCQKVAHPKQKCAEASTVSSDSMKKTATTKTPSVDIRFDDKNEFPSIIENQIQPITSSLQTDPKPIIGLNVPTVAQTGKQDEQQNEKRTTRSDSIDNDDDDEDGENANDSSSTQYDTNEDNNKRRVSTKHGKERKKMCSSQGAQMNCESSSVVSDKEMSNSFNYNLRTKKTPAP